MNKERSSEPTIITSGANPIIKTMRSLRRRKFRQSERAFLVEGRRLAEEGVNLEPESIRLLLVREDVPQSWWHELRLDVSRIRRVAAPVFDAASDVEHAQGVAAICNLPDVDIPEALAHVATPVLILDRLRDPGNVGTTLRTAAAAGVELVLSTPGTADPWSPKVLRAGMGAHFRLRVGEFSEDEASFLREGGRDVVYADAGASTIHHRYDWRRAAALIIGGETEPLSMEVEPLITNRVSVPMRAGVESLNAAIAASVLLYEAQRQGAFDR